MVQGATGVGITALVALLPILAETTSLKPVGDPHLVIAERRVSQVGADWRIQYHLRYLGKTPLDLQADDVAVDYEAVVSNARCPYHGYPQSIGLELKGAAGLCGYVDLIDGDPQTAGCRERVSVEIVSQVDPGRSSGQPRPIVQVAAVEAGNDLESMAGSARDALVEIGLQPGATLTVVVELKHEHRVCLGRDPLLGPRHLRMRLGPAVVEDFVNLDREQERAGLALPTLAPDASRCDASTYRSPPVSLHLHEGLPRDLSYYFPSVPVRHGSTVWVSFWYCVSPDSRGTCRSRVVEYRDNERGWTRLGDGFDEPLPARGRWDRFERQLIIRPEATTLTLDFRFADGRAGEAWIDDVEILPVTPVDSGR